MTALISLLTVTALSLLTVRIATVALTLTGLSREAAEFQASSAFTGVGFTTHEAEQIVNHPVRRRIAKWVMFLGNVGIVTAVSSLLLTFVETADSPTRLVRMLWLGIGLAILWFLGTSRWVDRHLSRLIQRALQRWTHLDVRDYAALLKLSGEYAVVELTVQEIDWLADRTLSTLGLHEEGVLVLGIYRPDGHYVGAPGRQTRVYANDTLILYGRISVLQELDSRLPGEAGEEAHRIAKAIQSQLAQSQMEEDATYAHPNSVDSDQ